MDRVTTFEVRRDDLAAYRWSEQAVPPPAGGEALLAVEKFAFTSNNVTYGAYGDRLRYWDFFPAESGWGRIPVWGYVRVLASAVDGLEPGQRFYGYVPMASHLRVIPAKVGAPGFVDAAAHRQPMPAIYSRYARTGAPDENAEALEMLLRPLFLTSFLLHEFLQREHWFGAKRIVISSASSKTAYGAAFLMAQAGAPEMVGLTSPRNRTFVEALGCYARTLAYDQLETLPSEEPTLYVDFSGGKELLSRVHHHFSRLVHSCTAGGTQWDGLDDGAPLPGPKPELFFAAPQMARGGSGLQQRMSEGWRDFCARIVDPRQPWMQISQQHGRAAVEDVYTRMLQGTVAPQQGCLLSL